MTRALRILPTLSVLLCAAPAARAADTPGTTVLTLRGAAAAGITASAFPPATRSGRAIVLPAGPAAAGAIPHTGTVRLRAGRRTVTLSAISLRTTGVPALRARIGGRAPMTVLVLGGAQTTTTAAATVTQYTGSLTVAARTALRRALGRPRPALRRFAVVRRVDAPPAPPEPPAPGNPSSGCPGGPSLLARPASAVDVTGATLGWRVRESFIRYINSGQGTAASGGATAAAPVVIAPATTPLVYDFSFPLRSGWTDPATGQSRLLFSGAVTFRWTAHAIDLLVSDPEVEVGTGGARAVFCIVNRANPGETARRTVLVTLNASGGIAAMPATVPAGAAEDTFAGYYFPGDPFGSLGVTGLVTG